MTIDLGALLPDPDARTQRAGRWVWGTVTQADPLRVRLDGDTTALDLTPDALTDGHVVGGRVLCQIVGRSVVVHGTPDTGWTTVSPAAGWTVNNTLQVRRIGAVVYWRGRVTPDASVSGTQTIVAAGGVPSWARPSSVYHAMRACPSSHTSSVAENRVKVAAVQPDGSLVAWYGTSNADQITLSGLSGYVVD